MTKDEFIEEDENKISMKTVAEKKADEPWTNKERDLIVQHVLTHVLGTVGYGNVFAELPEMLAKKGCPIRKKEAYKDQWRRKICKDLLGVYGGQSSASPATPTKATASLPKAEGSPSKRKRKEE